jgi:hypothetical protein
MGRGCLGGSITAATRSRFSTCEYRCKFLYLTVHLIKSLANEILQPCPTVVGEVASEHPHLF